MWARGNGEIEIALAEAALIEIGVDRAEGVAFVSERDAERIGIMTETVGPAGCRACFGDPDRVALAADEFGEGVAELGWFLASRRE